MRKSNRHNRNTIHNALKRRVMIRDHHQCRYCGALAQVLDHVLPVTSGGRNTDENLVASCSICNYLAGAHVFESFLAKKAYVLHKRSLRPELDDRTICVDCHEPFDSGVPGATRFLCADCNGEDLNQPNSAARDRKRTVEALNALMQRK